MEIYQSGIASICHNKTEAARDRQREAAKDRDRDRDLDV